jgi:hypothetical protein
VAIAPAPVEAEVLLGVEEQAASRARPAKAPNTLNFILKTVPCR